MGVARGGGAGWCGAAVRGGAVRTTLGRTCMAIIRLFSFVPDALAAEPTQAPNQAAESHPDPLSPGFPKTFSFQALIRWASYFFIDWPSGSKRARKGGRVSGPDKTATSRVEL